ncbi:MAG: hypothetical protein WA192_16655 [Candidatus Acidiferrales bacterium]
MTTKDDATPETNQSSENTNTPPPVAPQSRQVLSRAEQGPPDNRVNTAVNVPQKHWTIDWLPIGINAALAVIGVFAICIYGDQLSQMRTANEISKESLVSVQRAFVGFSGAIIGMKIPDGIGKHIVTMRLNTPWINSGNTPTKDAVSQVNWISLPGGLPDNFSYPDLANAPKSQFALGPKVAGNTTLDVPIEYFEATSKKTTRLFVYGWFTYRDIFSNTPLRLTEFCDEIIDVKANFPLSDPNANVTWGVALCGSHNCNDEQCEDYQLHAKPNIPGL